MGILSWDKPAKKMSTPAWKDDAGFDGGPVGGFQSNMSDDDLAKWKAKLTGTKLGYPQVEIRKDGGIVIIVNLGKGYNYKQYRAENPKYLGKTLADMGSEAEYYTQQQIDGYAHPTEGLNVHIATNGPIQFTFAEMIEMNQAVLEAKQFLENFEKQEIA
jgi:hypothetical protein